MPHWGDLPLLPDTDSGIAAIEREQITKPRPVEVEAPKLYQPCGEIVKHESVKISDELQDPFTLHTIQLNQHAKKLKTFLLTSIQHQESGKSEKESRQNTVASLHVPEIPEFPQKRKLDATTSIDPESMTKKRFSPPPELSLSVTRKILKKSAGAICAHVGFETTTESVLDFLTDIVHEYYQKITLLLRKNVDREAQTGHTGFVDVLEQTFQDAGVGSIVTLQQFYQNRIIGYHSSVLRRVQGLMDSYEKLHLPEVKCVEELKVVKENDNQISEIQFPVIQEVEDVYQEPAQIQLQLEELQSTVQNMECDANTSLKDEVSGRSSPGSGDKKDATVSIVAPNLDPDDEIINVSDSPKPTAVSQS